MPASGSGASARYPLAGEPDRMIAPGLRARISASGVVPAMISENTPSSRTRRAISCVYWLPTSRIRTDERAMRCRSSGEGMSGCGGMLQRVTKRRDQQPGLAAAAALEVPEREADQPRHDGDPWQHVQH